LAEAQALDHAGNPRCVDAYFQACAEAWQEMAMRSGCSSAECADAQCTYNSALQKLLYAACQHGRLNPDHGILIVAGPQSVTVPVDYQGFRWQPSDFERLHPPPKGHEPLLDRSYGNPGLGLPLVAERTRHECDPLEARFYPEKSFFPTTVVLTFGDFPSGDCAAAAHSAELRFINPISRQHLSPAIHAAPLATDLTASLAVTLDNAQRTYFAGFFEPGTATTRARLNFLEPYQPGKTPVVLIHGLFSDPLSWADMTNDLRATPGFNDRYQIWVFRYPTGQGFMQSATALRRELRAAVDMLDPQGTDPALHRLVLVGHSMGGLIAKLQVTHAEELLWNELANRPLETIVTTEQTRRLLAESCYFDPNPDIARVIFIAAPHSGSLPSSSIFGRSIATMIQTSPEQQEMHNQLMRDNPHTFNPLIEQRMPTSIDMLSPRSPLLTQMRKMRIGCNVQLHNIIGCSQLLSTDGPSDGVVSVHSASHPGCQSVLKIHAKHTHIHRTEEASTEVLRILNVSWCRAR
jgi:pimeloyl-ACP methyl ester carboxylesterase